MTLNQIKHAVLMGYPIYHRSKEHEVVYNSKGEFAIKDKNNGICTDLFFEKDGKEIMNGESEDFFSNDKDALFVQVTDDADIIQFSLDGVDDNSFTTDELHWMAIAQPGQHLTIDNGQLIRINKIFY